MPKFTIEGSGPYELIQSKFTFAEAKAIEKATGLPIQSILNDADVQGRADVIQAFFWVSMKRVDPTITFAALDDMGMDSIDVLDDEDEVEAPQDPTAPAAAPESAAESSEAPEGSLSSV